MQNLNQVRARSALTASEKPIPGREGGDVVKKVPAAIMNHGLLSALAFSKDNDSWKELFDRLAQLHLSDPAIELLDKAQADRDGLLRALVSGDSQYLKRVTSETLAWMEFAQRFIKKQDGEGKS